jgi:Polysaccharide biosynthesis protein
MAGVVSTHTSTKRSLHTRSRTSARSARVLAGSAQMVMMPASVSPRVATAIALSGSPSGASTCAAWPRSNFGPGTALIQRSTISDKHNDALFWIGAAIGAGLTLVVAALAPLIAAGHDRPELLQLTLSPLLGALALQQQTLLKRELRSR